MPATLQAVLVLLVFAALLSPLFASGGRPRRRAERPTLVEVQRVSVVRHPRGEGLTPR